MSRKPETTFTAAVHKHLPRELHREKMANPYRGGTPDCYYSGKRKDLWVEYKFIPKLPTRSTTSIVVELSPLQIGWLNGRYDEGRNVAVIIGCPEGGIVLRCGAWMNSLDTPTFRAQIKSRKELAEWIISETMK